MESINDPRQLDVVIAETCQAVDTLRSLAARLDGLRAVPRNVTDDMRHTAGVLSATSRRLSDRAATMLQAVPA